MQILIFTPRMALLVHIHMHVDDTAAHGWDNKGIVITASSVGPILRELSLAARRQHIHASVGRAPGEYNNMADATSRFTHLPDRQFISHFCSHFPYNKPWLLPPMPSDYNLHLITMLLKKQSPRVS